MSELRARFALGAALLALWLAGPLARELPRGAERPRFTPPVPGGGVSSGYGWRVREDGRVGFHAGVDVEAPEGAPVLAAAPGVVRRVGDDPEGYGRYVLVQHAGGWETLYAHNAEVAVREGQEVRRGQVIARVGRTGNATSPHLHLEIRVRGRPRDPLPLLGLGGVR